MVETLTNCGRTELIDRINGLERLLGEAERAKAAQDSECRAILAAVLGTDGDPIAQALAKLGGAILRGRRLHPDGCALRHLLCEVGEVADAMCEANGAAGGNVGARDNRVREELLDVAVVAMRMYLGEACT